VDVVLANHLKRPISSRVKLLEILDLWRTLTLTHITARLIVRFGPVIKRALAGMLQHIYADGRLGCIQPIGAAPGHSLSPPAIVYGADAFLISAKQMKEYVR
jgi:hypothetical protein